MALAGYLAVGLIWAWPLPAHLGDALLGSPDGDIGEYVWNIWVFYHQIVAHHASPLYTSEILSLTQPAALTLQNYTPFADLIAFPLIPALGVVRAFNVVTILAAVLSAYAMFVYARYRTGDAVAGWVGGLVFGFSAYITARQSGHLSLALAAPLPIFALLLYRVAQQPRMSLAAWAGAVVAWAYLCDPYYAVYCLLILAFMVVYSSVTFTWRNASERRTRARTLLDVMIFATSGFIVALLVTGGATLDLLSVRVSITGLYTPVLIVSTLLLMRLALMLRARLSLAHLGMRAAMPLACVATTAMCLVLAPVLVALASPGNSPLSTSLPLYWRSSPHGVDLIAYFLPSPYHPMTPAFIGRWLEHQPNGLLENVAGLSWVALATIAIATVWKGFRPHIAWVVFTMFFGLLSLGPFIHVANVNTYIPTPWALLRYVPIIGAARMPTRLAILPLLGVAMLAAMALQHLRLRVRRPRLAATIVAFAVMFELLPWPTPLYSAAVPSVNRVIAADPREVRVLNLPLGLRDGVSSRGEQTAEAQYHQTFHQKQLIGGYLSRLPPGEIDRYLRIPLMSELLDLSEGHPLDPARAAAALAKAAEVRAALEIGWVVVDRQRAGPELVDFAKRAFDLAFADSDGHWDLYRVSLDGQAIPPH